MKQQKRCQSLALAFLLTLALAGVVGAYSLPAQAAGNTLTLETISAAAGTSGSFAIMLDNSDSVASGQVRFTYAASLGLTITGVQVTGRAAGFTSTGSAYNTGTASLAGYQVIFYNLSNLTIGPGTGSILTISYTLAADASGNSMLPFTQAILSTAAAQALPLTTVNGALTITATVTATSTATSTATNTAIATPTSPATGTATATLTETPIATVTTPPPPPTPAPAGTTSTPTPIASRPAQIYLPLIQR